MPRQARLLLENVCYHVVVRGNRQQDIFLDNEDRIKHLRLIFRYKKKHKFKLLGWCLMDNHVHMIIESDKLSKVMHNLNLTYAKYFQYKYKLVGHFWQDRFKSYIVIKDRYLFNCVNYIENNPVRAKIVDKPEDYAWSSYRARICGERNELLDPIRI